MKYYREEQPLIELYDHSADDNETVNIAGEQPEIVERLMPILELGNSGQYDKK